MPRQRKLRPDLDTTGALINDQGLEVGRMTLSGNLILDPIAVYSEIEKQAALHYGRCKVTALYITFGRYGTWAFEPAVATILNEFEADNFIKFELAGDYVRPIAMLKKVADKYPPYLTRKQVLAGLEPIEES